MKVHLAMQLDLPDDTDYVFERCLGVYSTMENAVKRVEKAIADEGGDMDALQWTLTQSIPSDEVRLTLIDKGPQAEAQQYGSVRIEYVDDES